MNIPGSSDRRRRGVFRVARLVAAGAVALALWACGPVYIPVPPPGEVSFTAEPLIDSSGAVHTFWIARGGPNGNAASATFSIIDRASGQGVITTAATDGSFVAGPLEGTLGDQVTISYRDAQGRESPAACRLLSELPLAAACP